MSWKNTRYGYSIFWIFILQPNKNKTDLLNNKTFPNALKGEIGQAVIDLKKNKSPGSNEITKELIKCAETELLDVLHKLFNKILDSEDIPW